MKIPSFWQSDSKCYSQDPGKPENVRNRHLSSFIARSPFKPQAVCSIRRGILEDQLKPTPTVPQPLLHFTQYLDKQTESLTKQIVPYQQELITL